MYGKIVNGVLEYAPATMVTDTGRVIFNFSSNLAKLAEYGYKEVIDIQPEYDPNTQYVILQGYTQTEDTITVMYQVVNSTGEKSEVDKQVQILAQSLAQTATDEVAARIPLLFPNWEVDVTYVVGDRLNYGGVLYKCLNEHTSQSSWNPMDAPSLWAKVLTDPSGAILDWIQPDSTNPYMKGDKVKHNSKTWVSTVDNNVWEPGVYGWEEVSE